MEFDITNEIEGMPNEGNRTTLTCNHTQIDSKYVKSIIQWFKNGQNYSIFENQNVTKTGNQLQFTYLNHLIHNGVYECQIELITGQVVSSNTINMKVNCINSTHSLDSIILYQSSSFFFCFSRACILIFD